MRALEEGRRRPFGAGDRATILWAIDYRYGYWVIGYTSVLEDGGGSSFVFSSIFQR